LALPQVLAVAQLRDALRGKPFGVFEQDAFFEEDGGNGAVPIAARGFIGGDQQPISLRENFGRLVGLGFD
jgi:hypothetical protein